MLLRIAVLVGIFVGCGLVEKCCAFQKVSEFYIKLLLQQEKEHDEDNLRYLKVTIRNTMKMINLNRKKLLANRPPHEVTYLEKALDSIPVFDTQFP